MSEPRGAVSRLVAAAWLACAACGGNESDRDSEDDSATGRLARETADLTDSICACAPEGTEDACSQSSARQLMLSECESAILNRPEAAQLVECIIARFASMRACMEDNACDPIESQFCLLRAQALECPVPEDVQAARETCPEHAPFVCADGQHIRKYRRCDDIPHCSDGSDEVDCSSDL